MALSYIITYANVESATKYLEVYDNIIKDRSDIKTLIVASEIHPNTKGYHIHVYVEFNMQTNLDCKSFDKYCGKHANYRQIRNNDLAVRNYVMKGGIYKVTSNVDINLCKRYAREYLFRGKLNYFKFGNTSKNSKINKHFKPY